MYKLPLANVSRAKVAPINPHGESGAGSSVEVLRAVIADPAHRFLVDSFDDMREKRNEVAYEAGEASELEAGQAIDDAARLLTVLRPIFDAMFPRRS